jgi:hypothetical protein
MVDPPTPIDMFRILVKSLFAESYIIYYPDIVHYRQLRTHFEQQVAAAGSIFEAQANVVEQKIYPIITGSAYVTGESVLHFDSADPFRYGLVPE